MWKLRPCMPCSKMVCINWIALDVEHIECGIKDLSMAEGGPLELCCQIWAMKMFNGIDFLKPRQLLLHISCSCVYDLFLYQNALPSAKSLHKRLVCALVLLLLYIEIELFLKRDVSNLKDCTMRYTHLCLTQLHLIMLILNKLRLESQQTIVFLST